MSMRRLWAPWRMRYIRKSAGGKRCIFCRPAPGELIFSTRCSVVMPNIFPYNNGHLLAAPKRHVADISLLSKDELLDMFEALAAARAALDTTLQPQGYNIGINIAAASGAGITGHVHLHIVPRWVGDTNFMPVLNSSKVISQSLDELKKQLKAAMRKQKNPHIKIH